jgi:hypothetical protein
VRHKEKRGAKRSARERLPVFGYGQMSRRSLNKGCACPPRNQNVAEGVLVGRNSSWIYNDSALDADRNSRKFELLRDSELGLARRHCRGHLKRHQVVITACVFIVFWATHRKNRICRAASCCNLAMILRSKKPWSLGDLAPKKWSRVFHRWCVFACNSVVFSYATCCLSASELEVRNWFGTSPALNSTPNEAEWWCEERVATWCT